MGCSVSAIAEVILMPQSYPKPLWKICTHAALEAELRGDRQEAEHQYVYSLMLAEESNGSKHEDVGEALINLADFCMAQSRFDEALDYYQRALAVYDQVFGEDNLVNAMIYSMLADVSIAQKRQLEAHAFKAKAASIMGQRQAS